MRESASFPSQGTRGTKGDTAGFQRSKRAEALKWLTHAARAAEDAQKNRIRSSELQKVIEHVEKERSRLLEIIERKQKLKNWSS